MNSNDIALDDFAGTRPQMIRDDFVERSFTDGSVPTDTEVVWLADPPSPVSLAYRRAATLLSIYRSRIDFLDQCRFESGVRTN